MNADGLDWMNFALIGWCDDAFDKRYSPGDVGLKIYISGINLVQPTSTLPSNSEPLGTWQSVVLYYMIVVYIYKYDLYDIYLCMFAIFFHSFSFSEIRGDLSKLLRGLWLRDVFRDNLKTSRFQRLKNLFLAPSFFQIPIWRIPSRNSLDSEIFKSSTFRFSTFFTFHGVLGVFLRDLFLTSRPRASFWRSVAMRRRHQTTKNGIKTSKL